MMHAMLWVKNYYWVHRDVARIAGVGGGLFLAELVLVLWTVRRLGELAHIRERMSRLADGLAQPCQGAHVRPWFLRRLLPG